MNRSLLLSLLALGLLFVTGCGAGRADDDDDTADDDDVADDDDDTGGDDDDDSSVGDDDDSTAGSDADGDGVTIEDGDCDDTDASIGTWDNSSETASLTDTSKQWTYEYDNPPNFSTSDLNYDGLDGALNDGVESYYGDSLSDPDGNGSVDGDDWAPYWAWWQNSDPSVILHVPEDALEVSSVGFYASCCGGGIGVPSPAEVYHRPNSSSAWTLVGSATPANVQGWSTVPVSPVSGGELRLGLTHSSEHSILGELRMLGSCSP